MTKRDKIRAYKKLAVKYAHKLASNKYGEHWSVDFVCNDLKILWGLEHNNNIDDLIPELRLFASSKVYNMAWLTRGNSQENMQIKILVLLFAIEMLENKDQSWKY